MKWLLLGILGVLVAASFLAYALIPDASDDDRTVLTWVTGDNPTRRGTIELFEDANPQIRVQLDPGNTGLEKIIVQCKGGIGPDVFSVYGRWQLVDYVRTGVLVPLDPYAGPGGFSAETTWSQVLDEISFEQFNPATGRYERHQYTYPANVNADVMLFNKRLFREAGITEGHELYPRNDWSWDECLAAARRLTRRDARGRTIQYGIGTYEFEQTCGLVWQLGGSVFDPTQTYCVLDSPQALNAIRLLHRMLVVDEVMMSRSKREEVGAQGGWGGGHPGPVRARADGDDAGGAMGVDIVAAVL